MNTSDIQFLFDYNYWANARLIKAAAQIAPEQWAAPARLSHGSIRGAMVHIYSAERVWRMRFHEHISLTDMPAQDDFPTVASLQAEWQHEESAIRAFLAALDDSALDQQFAYTNTRGQAFSRRLGRVLLHVVNHGTQFRSEAAVALSELGFSPGDLDLYRYDLETSP